MTQTAVIDLIAVLRDTQNRPTLTETERLTIANVLERILNAIDELERVSADSELESEWQTRWMT